MDQRAGGNMNPGNARMSRTLQSYHKGGVVKETGPALLKKGEVVVPTDAYSAAESALNGGAKKEPKPKLHEIRVKRGHKKGYIATHHHTDQHGNHHPAVHEYPIATQKELMEHMSEHMGEESDEAAQGGEEAGESPKE